MLADVRADLRGSSVRSCVQVAWGMCDRRRAGPHTIARNGVRLRAIERPHATPHNGSCGIPRNRSCGPPTLPHNRSCAQQILLPTTYYPHTPLRSFSSPGVTPNPPIALSFRSSTSALRTLWARGWGWGRGWAWGWRFSGRCLSCVDQVITQVKHINDDVVGLVWEGWGADGVRGAGGGRIG